MIVVRAPSIIGAKQGPGTGNHTQLRLSPPLRYEAPLGVSSGELPDWDRLEKVLTEAAGPGTHSDNWSCFTGKTYARLVGLDWDLIARCFLERNHCLSVDL